MFIPTLGRDWSQPWRAVLTPANCSSALREVGITIMFCSSHPVGEKWASWWGVVSAQAAQAFLGNVLCWGLRTVSHMARMCTRL